MNKKDWVNILLAEFEARLIANKNKIIKIRGD